MLFYVYLNVFNPQSHLQACFRQSLLFAAALTLAACSAGAQTAKPAAPSPKLTLAQALLAMPPPTDGLLLAVSAEKVTLPNGVDAPASDTSAGAIAGTFGGMTHSFGDVTALAPVSMIVLNTQPDTPNILADINPFSAVNILAASLDDKQWQALTSEHGLGLADLTGDTQRSLFEALFPGHRLWVGSEDPALKSAPPEQRADVRDVSDQIDTTRIRMGQAARLRLHDTQGKTIYFGADRPDAAQRLHTWRPKSPPPLTRYGVLLKEAVPNILKPSDLDWDKRALQVPVPAAGLKTVGELVTRIGQKTGTELYADPHYAAQTLTVIGTASAAPAADWLRALCVCVTGTFRKVGPAYVLTDDLVGVGVRRTQISEWEDAGAAVKDRVREQAGSAMLHRRIGSARTLPKFGDPLAITPDEMKLLPDDPLIPGLPQSINVPLPFSQLSPAQQGWMRQMAAGYDEKLHTGAAGLETDRTEADLTHDAEMQVYYQVQLLVPSESRPVDTTLSFPLFELYAPSSAELLALEEAKAAQGQQTGASALPPAPPLSGLLHGGRCRAVRGRPRSAAEVDALVTAMQTLGLNQLWLDVFSDGVDHSQAAGVHGPDIISEALTRTHGTGITVYADLSLLAWGDAPPQDVRDLTITGLDSRAEAVRANAVEPSTAIDDAGKPIPFTAPPVQVSPTSRTVQQTLLALVQSLAARPGLAGFVWEDAKPSDATGYTQNMRLAFLRTYHADPLDISAGITVGADTLLPLFNDPAIESGLNDHWTQAKAGAILTLLLRLRGAARRTDGTTLPLLMEQELVQKHWFASWDDPKQTPPSLQVPQFSEGDDPLAQVFKAARSHAKVVVSRETVPYDGDAAALARKLQDEAKLLPGAGFVLDFSAETVAPGTTPLTSLVRAVSAKTPANK